MAKRQRDAYAEQKEGHKKRRKFREKEAIENERFKVLGLQAYLITAQPNVTSFPTFTSAFCPMENQTFPKPLELPTLPDAPDISCPVESSSESGDVSAVPSEHSIDGHHGDEEEAQKENETGSVEHISSSNL